MQNPRWDTPSVTLFTKRKKDPLKNVDDDNIVPPLVLYLSGNDKGVKDDFDPCPGSYARRGLSHTPRLFLELSKLLGLGGFLIT